MIHNFFNDIEDTNLRNYNRFCYARNLLADKGQAYYEDYMAVFEKHIQDKIYNIGLMVNKFGTKNVIKELTKNMEFADE